MNHMNFAKSFSIFITYLSAVIRRPVINKDQLEIPKRLPQNRINALAQIRLDLVDRDYDRDFRHNQSPL